MGCKQGYPKEPCPFGFEGRVTRETCGACKHFTPPPHILSWCTLYDRTGQVCTLPKSSCNACPFRLSRGVGRPKGEGEIDWQDTASVKRYHAKYVQEHKDQVAQRFRDWKDKNPDYFRDYYKQNKEKILKYQKDRRVAAKRANDSSTG